MMMHRFEQGKKLFGTFRRVIVDFCVGRQKTAEQKSPCRTLVVGGITFGQGTAVNAVVVSMVTGERAQASADIEMFFGKCDDPCFLLFR